MEDAVKEENLARIESVKRLPWTLPMLRRTEELALKLLQYRPSHLKELTDHYIHRRTGEEIVAQVKLEEAAQEDREDRWRLI